MSESAEQQRLLLVDDEPAILASFELAFEDGGWTVTTANSGEAAMDTFAPGKFDLVVTDKNLPVMSGVDVVAQVRKLDQDVTVMMLTGFGSKDSAIDTLNLGVDAYVEKPVRDIYRLILRAKTIMKRRQRRMQKAKEVGQQVGEQGFRSLVICPDETRARLITEHLEGQVDEVKVVSDLGAAQSHLAHKAYSLVVIEESTADFADAVARIKDEQEQMPIAVLGQALGLEVIMTLIEHGVTSIIKEPVGSVPCARRFVEMVGHVRRP